MEIRKFRGQSMREALDKVRQHLGEDAVILHTRTYVERDGWRFWRKREWVEITASRDVRILEDRPIARASRPVVETYRSVYQSGSGWKNRGGWEEGIHIPKHIQALREEIEELKEMTAVLLRRSQSVGRRTGIVGTLENFLAEQELDPKLVEILLTDLDSIEKEQETVRRLKERIFSLLYCDPIKKEVGNRYKIALIGPTGVGKTTTIAKLAARYSLLYRKRVGLLTVDTFRIAAVDQLRTYAEIMRLPIEVVVSPQDVPTALNRLSDREIIFVDTAGRSQRNDLQMSELRAFLNAISPDEVHLVLSTTSNYRTLKEILDRFSMVRYDKLLFTKMDETRTPGIILNGKHLTDKPISYITTGQSVPDDIEDAIPERLMRIIEEVMLESLGSGTKIA